MRHHTTRTTGGLPYCPGSSPDAMLRSSDSIPLEELTMRIGFVGLGTMGGPMARRLAAQGHQVTGYDVAAARAAQAREGGVTLATSPAGAAEQAEAVLSSLPDPAALRHAYLGADGVLSTVKAGAALLDLSTVDPDTRREIAAAAQTKGADCLDAPVSGGPAEAGTGKLVFLVGGEAAVAERWPALLMDLGTSIHHVRPPGPGPVGHNGRHVN